jgi:UDP-N-acetylglucosamine--N-acetylmuramyl-(pentapeptide) pyrophosphoryl-undecaprenol N-acetylglucosamine transferase
MPALAIAEELRRRRPDLEPVMVGAERGIEAQLLPTRDFRYHLLPAEPIYRRQWWKNARWPFTLGRLISSMSELFEVEQPAAVLGTGGYASGPVVWAAARRGVPTAIQEQNAFPGLASRLLAPRVRQIYLGLPEARARLNPGQTTQVFDTGNPITPPDPARRAAARARFGLAADLPSRGAAEPTLLITGGSQGALAINRVVAAWLEQGGGRGITVLWATGRGSHPQFARFHAPPSVQVFDFIDPMADAYAVADLVVARAGMMTGAELCAWGLPSILIPLPSAAADHQRYNAEALDAAGASRMVPQRTLTPVTLRNAVRELLADEPQRLAMAEAARRRGRPRAAADIAGLLSGLI